MTDNRGISGRNVSGLDASNGAVPFTFSVQTVAGTSDYPITSALGYRIRVIDAWAVATAAGGAGDTVVIQNGTDNIISLNTNVSDAVVVRAPAVSDSFHTIAPDGVLKVTSTSDATAIVYIQCVRVNE